MCLKKLHKTHTKTQHTEHSDVYVQIFQSETVKPVKVYKHKGMRISNWNVTSAGWQVTLCDPIMAREF